MATSSNSNSTADHEKKSSRNDDEQDYISNVGWKTLFTFTTKQHLTVLVGGITAASVAALSMPAFAIVYGLIFGQYTSYGEGSIESNQLMSNITRFCIILTGLATLNWIANSFYFFCFLMFGELQARSARNRIFDALIKKDLAWFDMRETGIAGFLPTVQMWVSLSHRNSCR
jgi:ATP-binding cassette subfamily B (MDR/TAP) protein 1